jgi:hypothetical protein
MQRSLGRERLGFGQEPLIAQQFAAVGGEDQLDPLAGLDAGDPSTDRPS